MTSRVVKQKLLLVSLGSRTFRYIERLEELLTTHSEVIDLTTDDEPSDSTMETKDGLNQETGEPEVVDLTTEHVPSEISTSSNDLDQQPNESQATVDRSVVNSPRYVPYSPCSEVSSLDEFGSSPIYCPSTPTYFHHY